MKHLQKGHESRASSTSPHGKAGPLSKWPTSDAAPASCSLPWTLEFAGVCD